MRNLIFIAVVIGFFTSRSGLASTCCVVDSIRFYPSLHELQKSDFSLSSSYQTQTEEISSNLSFQLASAIRLTPNIEIFGKLPVIQRPIKDTSLGVRVTAVRSLFPEEWFPTISVFALNPWEPSVGASLRKEYRDWSSALDISFDSLTKGRQMSVIGSLGYLINRDWNAGSGASHRWGLEKTPRSSTLFAYANYYLDQFTSVGGYLDAALPLNGIQTISVSFRYGFY